MYPVSITGNGVGLREFAADDVDVGLGRVRRPGGR